MLKGSSNVINNIQTLALIPFWASPKSLHKCGNVSIFSTFVRKQEDLGVSVSVSVSGNTNNGIGVSKDRNLAWKLRLGSLSEEGESYEESFIVRSFEVGINKTATVETIANLLQEVGRNHFQSIAFSTNGVGTMRKRNLLWVTTGMHIEILRYPAWNDVVEIEVWHHPEGKLGTRRDFIIKDCANGEIIGRSTSKWVMMNKDTRKVDKDSAQVVKECLVYCPQTLRFAFPEHHNKNLWTIPKLKDPPQYSKLGLVPRMADLDMNQHVNYVTYIGWVLESMPREVIQTYELRSITLDYRRECQVDDIVDSFSNPELIKGRESTSKQIPTNKATIPKGDDENECLQFLHLLRLSADGSEINWGRSEWRRKLP